jgi:sulfide:quinone oxidoreductase
MGRKLVNETIYSFAGLSNKRKPTRKDLEKYDVVIIGCNLGGVLSR